VTNTRPGSEPILKPTGFQRFHRVVKTSRSSLLLRMGPRGGALARTSGKPTGFGTRRVCAPHGPISPQQGRSYPWHGDRVPSTSSSEHRRTRRGAVSPPLRRRQDADFAKRRSRRPPPRRHTAPTTAPQAPRLAPRDGCVMSGSAHDVKITARRRSSAGDQAAQTAPFGRHGGADARLSFLLMPD
jgi:hypothetical protein